MIGHCPEPAILARIGRGAEAGTCDPDLAAHIEDCPDCQEFLRRRGESGLSSLSGPGEPEPPAHGTFPEIDGFTMERELGRGATGVVYLARREAPRRQVALKLWPGGRQAGEKERRKWLREAEAASTVRHPNVVTLYDAFVTDDWFLLVLEWVPGGTLADRLSQPLAPRTAAQLVESIARAVQHIHESRLLHLDLKPSNILLDGKAGAELDALVPKVSDFGIARSPESSATETAGPGAGGTPSYMAPEQITKPRTDLTAQADIHGLGAILYHALTGRPPYQAATVLETIDHVRRLDAVPPRRLNPGIPRDLETICLKCLQKEPGRRYASAEALGGDLTLWLEGRPITARPVSAAEKSWRWWRRRPVIAALTAALLLTLSVSLADVIVFWRRAEAHLRTSTEMAGDLVNLAIGANSQISLMMSPERTIPILEQQRRRLLTLTASGLDDDLVARPLARVESALAGHLMQARRYMDARVILLGLLGRLEELAQTDPADATWRAMVRARCHMLSEVCAETGSGDVCIVDIRRAIELLDRWLREAPSSTDLVGLVALRRDLAWLLYDRGDREQAALLIAANRRSLENAPAGCEGPLLKAELLICHIEWCEFAPGAAPVVAPKPGDHKTGGSSALSRLVSARDASQAPADWARLAADALRCDDPDPRAADNRESAGAFRVADQLAKMVSRLRRVHDLDAATRVTEKLLALANHFVEHHPDQSACYRALSIAYAQLCENACELNHETEIEPIIRKAVIAARQALFLDPTDGMAWHAQYNLEHRYVELAKRR
jgi:serine/threonine protein kinase